MVTQRSQLEDLFLLKVHVCRPNEQEIKLRQIHSTHETQISAGIFQVEQAYSFSAASSFARPRLLSCNLPHSAVFLDTSCHEIYQHSSAIHGQIQRGERSLNLADHLKQSVYLCFRIEQLLQKLLLLPSLLPHRLRRRRLLLPPTNLNQPIKPSAVYPSKITNPATRSGGCDSSNRRTGLGVELLDPVALLVERAAEGRCLLLEPGDLGGERLRVGLLRRRGGGRRLREARAGGLEEEAGRRVGAAAGRLADGARPALLRLPAAGPHARAVLQPLLQAANTQQ